MPTALYYDPLFLQHDTLRGHPERPSRLEACYSLLHDSGLLDRLDQPPCRDATLEELARVHTPRHIEAMCLASEQGPAYLDPDTVTGPGTYEAAVRAAGAVLSATEAVVHGDATSAFCLTRPPGHHAVPQSAMGFCIFNSVAVTAAHARATLGLDRVAIVDFDIHHGNGTQDAFYDDPAVLYVSTHQYGGSFYPGTGHWSEVGKGPGRLSTLNVPLPGGCGDPEYALAFDSLILPRLRAFHPQLILVSAGYDAHFADPISGSLMRLSTPGYASLVARLQTAAAELCAGRLVLALEGGYDLTALSWSVRATLEVLAGLPITPDPLALPHPTTPPIDLTPLLTNLRTLHGL